MVQIFNTTFTDAEIETAQRVLKQLEAAACYSAEIASHDDDTSHEEQYREAEKAIQRTQEVILHMKALSAPTVV